ncbi:unnamed protein product, partial [marine sediment metagenome]
ISENLSFTNFCAGSVADNLELETADNGSTASYDDKTITIVGPTISSAANQTFAVGDPATAISTMTITDTSTPTITDANDIRIKIPSTFNMEWDISDTTATIGGGAVSKVSTDVSYEDSNKTLVLNVTENFAASDSITVSGLSFTELDPAKKYRFVHFGNRAEATYTDRFSEIEISDVAVSNSKLSATEPALKFVKDRPDTVI